MFSETLYSLVVFFLLAYLETHSTIQDEKTLIASSKISNNTLLKSLSLISPISMYLLHLFNAFIAQNLALTFVSYKNNYHKRIQFYKIFSLVTSLILLIIMIIFNNNGNSNNSPSLLFYNNFLVSLFYFVLFINMLYVINRIKFIIVNKKQFDTSIFQNKIEEEAISSFINFQTLLLILYVILNFPIIFIHIIGLYNTKHLEYNYYFLLYFPSASAIISLITKLNDPYIKKYLGLAFNIVTLKGNQDMIIQELEKPIENSQDISNLLYKNQNENLLNNDNLNNKVEMNDKERKSVESLSDIVANTYNRLNNTLSINDHLIRLIAISIAIENESFCDMSILSKQPLPWKNIDKQSNQEKDSDYYSEKTEFIKYNKFNFPSFLEIDENSDYYNSSFKVRSYSSFIFKNLRHLDGISNKDILQSLNYLINSNYLSKSVVSGGRSANPIMYTHDRKYLIKTISKNEKNKLLEILPSFHSKIGQKYSLLCRIYGLYRIKISGKTDTHIIIMKNMSDLPREVSIFIFK